MSDETTPQDGKAMSPASAGYAERWMLPDIPESATTKDRHLAARYTRVTKVVDEHWPDAHAAWLTVGSQRFKVTVCETKYDAGWHCWMLAQAMKVAIHAEEKGVLVEGPKVA